MDFRNDTDRIVNLDNHNDFCNKIAFYKCFELQCFQKHIAPSQKLKFITARFYDITIINMDNQIFGTLFLTCDK